MAAHKSKKHSQIDDPKCQWCSMTFVRVYIRAHEKICKYRLDQMTIKLSWVPINLKSNETVENVSPMNSTEPKESEMHRSISMLPHHSLALDPMDSNAMEDTKPSRLYCPSANSIQNSPTQDIQPGLSMPLLDV